MVGVIPGDNRCHGHIKAIVPGDHRYTVPALLKRSIFGGFLNRRWGLTSPVCDGTAPHWLVSLYHPPRIGRRRVELEPTSDFSQSSWGFHTVRGVTTGEKSDVLPGLFNV